ncbi:hypothetical protein OKW42_004516 [Paraburkholderia sp. WC7.3d]
MSRSRGTTHVLPVVPPCLRTSLSSDYMLAFGDSCAISTVWLDDRITRMATHATR